LDGISVPLRGTDGGDNVPCSIKERASLSIMAAPVLMKITTGVSSSIKAEGLNKSYLDYYCLKPMSVYGRFIELESNISEACVWKSNFTNSEKIHFLRAPGDTVNYRTNARVD
jgi:hypothetical protein